MVRESILHYKILEKLGEGGMGIVYLAEDLKLERKVAIKFLPHHISNNSEERLRFKIEAKAAASLNHHNITTIYSIEENNDNIFIVMEYIEGKELKTIIGSRNTAASLQINDAINYAIQIAEGLKAAHKKGIIHRDIKSKNIMITNDGIVKIMDFGLAKIKGEDITKAGSTLGTIAYMSPEQIVGEELNQSTDIWSFGIVLYEMITGELPFKGGYDQAVAYSIVNEKPNFEPLEQKNIPEEIKTLLKKMLEREREKRCQKVDEIISELKNIKGKIKDDSSITKKSAEDLRSSIAVLPLVNMSADPEQEYFCDGISEEIINVLTQLNNLRVIARTSAFAFKGKNLDVREIGKALDVKTLLEGSVRKAGNRLRITTQLIRVSDGSHLWSNRYDRVLEDVFSIQEDIAENVATALKGFLTNKEKEAIRRPETNIEAYEYFLKGRKHLNNLDFSGARTIFEKAIKLDPNYAPAYTGLTKSFCWLFEWQGSNEEDLHQADLNSLKALQLASNLSESHSSRGYVLALSKKYEEAEKEFEDAIRLNPNSFDAYYLYARSCFARGQVEKSVDLFEKAGEVQRDDFQSVILLSQSLYVIGRNNEALKAASKGIDRAKMQLNLEPKNVRALSLLPLALDLIGEKEEAFYWIEKGLKLYPNDQGMLTNAACFYAVNNIKDKALDILESVWKKGYGYKDWIENDPDYNSLRDEPRFKALLKKLE